MIEQISTYLKAEKTESLLFIFISLIAIGLSFWMFFKIRENFL